MFNYSHVFSALNFRKKNENKPPKIKIKKNSRNIWVNSRDMGMTCIISQGELLHKYSDLLSELNVILEREAFIKGVKFATAYLGEAGET